MTVHAPVPDYAAARQAMVDSQLRPQGVNDPLVIAAMSRVPREKFVPEEQRALAYADRALPLEAGRAMPAAAVTGLLLTALAPLRGETALIVGAGTGYSAAVLAEMGIKAVALESSPALSAEAKKNRARVVEGPLHDGDARSAPYDFILIDGAVEFNALLAQSPQAHACYIQGWMSYLNGHPLAPEEQPLLQELTTQSLAGQLSLRELVERLVSADGYLQRLP